MIATTGYGAGTLPLLYYVDDVDLNDFGGSTNSKILIFRVIPACVPRYLRAKKNSWITIAAIPRIVVTYWGIKVFTNQFIVQQLNKKVTVKNSHTKLIEEVFPCMLGLTGDVLGKSEILGFVTSFSKTKFPCFVCRTHREDIDKIGELRSPFDIQDIQQQIVNSNSIAQAAKLTKSSGIKSFSPLFQLEGFSTDHAFLDPMVFLSYYFLLIDYSITAIAMDL